MNSRGIARIVAIAMGVGPLLWGPTAHAQGAAALKLPDLTVSRISSNCTGMSVQVTNTGITAVSSTASPIIVRAGMLFSLEGTSTVAPDRSVSVAGLSPGQTRSFTFEIPRAPEAISAFAQVDLTNTISEASEFNNGRNELDEQRCPILTVSNARIAEGGDLVFEASLSSRPLNSASVSWATQQGTATGGTACGGTTDFVTASGSLLFSESEFVLLRPKTIRITTCRDASSESAETMRVVFSSLRNLHIKDSRAGTIDNVAP